MSASAASAASDAGAASSNNINGGKIPDVGFRPQANMAVVPPKKEDLQKSYASIVGDDHNPAGWYGSMSKFFFFFFFFPRFLLSFFAYGHHLGSH